MYRKHKGRKRQRPNKEAFEYQYYVLEMDAEELAKFYNVKRSTIYNWATTFRKEEMASLP